PHKTTSQRIARLMRRVTHLAGRPMRYSLAIISNVYHYRLAQQLRQRQEARQRLLGSTPRLGKRPHVTGLAAWSLSILAKSSRRLALHLTKFCPARWDYHNSSDLVLSGERGSATGSFVQSRIFLRVEAAAIRSHFSSRRGYQYRRAK